MKKKSNVQWSCETIVKISKQNEHESYENQYLDTRMIHAKFTSICLSVGQRVFFAAFCTEIILVFIFFFCYLNFAVKQFGVCHK